MCHQKEAMMGGAQASWLGGRATGRGLWWLPSFPQLGGRLGCIRDEPARLPEPAGPLPDGANHVPGARPPLLYCFLHRAPSETLIVLTAAWGSVTWLYSLLPFPKNERQFVYLFFFSIANNTAMKILAQTSPCEHGCRKGPELPQVTSRFRSCQLVP